MVWLLPLPALRVKNPRAIVAGKFSRESLANTLHVSRFTFHGGVMPQVPVKLYIDKLLKDCRDMTRHLALLSGPIKEKALRAMADRLAADEEKILAANEKDVDAVGKSFEADVMKDRMKAAVARLRMTADDIKEMVDRLRMIADLPDPVGAVTSRWERPDGLQVSRVRVPIGVIGVVSELSPLITVESIALWFKSGQPLCVSWRAGVGPDAPRYRDRTARSRGTEWGASRRMDHHRTSRERGGGRADSVR